MAYPMISLSYVFGMLAAMFIFHETIPLTRWVGVALIILGCIFVAK
jgi:undecaprenyl phosphate-alpha-L-ara4N flippase subunit ArnE